MTASEQEPVDDRDVDLALLGLGGAQHAEAGQHAELHRLLRDRERARDHRLAGDDRRHRGQDHHRQQRPGGVEQEERVLQPLGMGQQHGALAEIVEGERRQDEAEPGGADRRAAEMAEIGIERLGPGHRQEHRAQRKQPGRAVVDQEAEAMDRVDRADDAWIVQDVHQAAKPMTANQKAVIGPKNVATLAVPKRWTANRPIRMHEAERHHVGIEGRRHQLEPLDRREHRDRRA